MMTDPSDRFDDATPTFANAVFDSTRQGDAERLASAMNAVDVLPRLDSPHT